MLLGEANRTSEFRIVLAGPKFAGQDRVIREKITVEVILRELGSEEFNDIVIHEKLVKGVRIVHVGAIDRSDVCWRILEIIAVFEECSKYFEGLCSGGWSTPTTTGNISNKEVALVFVRTVQHFDIVRLRYTANSVAGKICLNEGWC